MTSKEIAAIGGVAIEEIFSCLSIPGGATASHILHKVFEKKAIEARDILLQEMSQGGAPEIAEDDAVYIIYRYLRAAQEGAARVNLRLLAQVIAGISLLCRHNSFAEGGGDKAPGDYGAGKRDHSIWGIEGLKEIFFRAEI